MKLLKIYVEKGVNQSGSNQYPRVKGGGVAIVETFNSRSLECYRISLNTILEGGFLGLVNGRW